MLCLIAYDLTILPIYFNSTINFYDCCTRTIIRENKSNSKPVGASFPLPAIPFNALVAAWFVPIPVGIL
jgi:hypothetical protein